MKRLFLVINNALSFSCEYLLCSFYNVRTEDYILFVRIFYCNLYVLCNFILHTGFMFVMKLPEHPTLCHTFNFVGIV